MPRVNPAELAPSQIYGKQRPDNNLTFGERLRKRFRPTDTVKVHNITNAAIEWQWLDENDETYTIEDGSNVKIVEREDPQLWRLGPGEQDIVQGSCAYLMIESLYKQTCAMKTGIVLHPLDEREIKNFAFDDPAKQDEFIDFCFAGKVTPQMMQEAAVASFGDFQPKILENLPAIATERDEYNRRSKAQHATQERRVHDAMPPAPTLDSLQDEFEDEDGVGDGSPIAPDQNELNAQEAAKANNVPQVELGKGQVGELIGEDKEAAAPTEPLEPSVKPLNRSKVVKEKQTA